MKTYNISFSGEKDTFITSLNEHGVLVNKVFDTLKVVNVSCVDGTALTEISQIVTIEEDQLIMPEISSEWHKLRVNTKQLPLRSVYTPKNLGDNIEVYVVDSGINKNHSELQNANIVDLYSYTSDFTDVLGHGTAVSSLIVGSTLGVSSNATLKNVKIETGIQVPVSNLLEAFNTILSDHLLTENIIKVVNCSWTVTKSQILDAKITELQNHGLVVVAAAGNRVEAANNYSPVGLNTVIGVAASDAYDRVINWATNIGSNWGPEVDITAPGIDVNVADIISGGIVNGSGTSYATAIVSGLLCQHIYNSSNQTAEQIKYDFLAKGISDILFRNESIYGTTPNLMAQAVYYDNIFIEPTVNYFTVKKGESLTIPFEFILPATSIGIDNVHFGSHVRIPPEWVVVLNNSLIITPTINVETSVYRIFVEARDVNNQQIALNVISVGVFNDTIEEINRTDPERYYTIDNNMIVVRLDACNNVGCDTFGNDDGACSSQIVKEGGCGCAGPFNCAQF